MSFPVYPPHPDPLPVSAQCERLRQLCVRWRWPGSVLGTRRSSRSVLAMRPSVQAASRMPTYRMARPGCPATLRNKCPRVSALRERSFGTNVVFSVEVLGTQRFRIVRSHSANLRPSPSSKPKPVRSHCFLPGPAEQGRPSLREWTPVELVQKLGGPDTGDRAPASGP